MDTRDAATRASEIARLCDGAGIDALWVRDPTDTDNKPDDLVWTGEHPLDTDGQPRMDPWKALPLLGAEVLRSRLGVMVTIWSRPPEELATMAGALDSAIGGRLELWFCDSDARPRRLRRYIRRLRDLLGEATPTISIEADTPDELADAARLADDVELMPLFPDTTSISEAVRTACDRADRDPGSLGVALLVPVSIGRTTAEAQARTEFDPRFRMLAMVTEKVGIFGTLEQCQERVIDLAHAGVTDLRCIIPHVPDVHDVIAQLTAITVGTVDVLTPGVPRSKAPDPPTGWGGRTNRA